MAWVEYTCPVCNKPVLRTNFFDFNCIEILFDHLKSWHPNELEKNTTDLATK